MSNKLIEVLQRMANESWRGSPEHAALTAAIASLSAPQPPARMAEIPESSPDGWLQAGGLLYRLTEGHRPENRDEIYVTMVHGSRDPAHCEARASEILAMLQSQPPAKAQAQGGGEAELRRMVTKLAAHVRPTCGELWAEAERLLNRTEPPSAPVGVEGLLPCPFCGGPAERIDFGPGDAENEGGSCIACTRCQASGPVEFGRKENFITNWNERAQQPAAVDGAARRRDVRFWMRHNAGSYSTATELAEAADEVFRLPDGGLDNETHWVWDEAAEAVDDSQRGVLSVTDDGEYRTNPIQHPAAVDDLMNAWRTAFITERATRYREGGMKIEQARIHAETDATLMEKIARQQQGGES